MKPHTGALLLLGLSLFVALVAWQGFDDVLALLQRAGFGVVVVALFHLVPLVLDAAGWIMLFPPGRRIRLRTASWLRWISESINSLLPVAEIGGEIVRARLLAQRGAASRAAASTPAPNGAEAGASVIVDLTVGLATQLAFALFGLALFAVLSRDGDVFWAVAIGVGTGVLALLGFLWAQRAGMFGFLARFVERVTHAERWPGLAPNAQALDQEIGRSWRRARGVLGCAFWRGVSWLAGAGEVWLALYFLGHPVCVVEALVLESMGQTARAVGFAIPAGLGVQEGGYLMVGQALGLGGEVALTVSLVRRVRELLLGVPGLVVWQLVEGRRLLRRRAAGDAASGATEEEVT